MILSHKKKFIHIKNTKVAGTSLEIALSRHCGTEDVITGIAAEDEIIRRNEGGKCEQNNRKQLTVCSLKDFAKFALGKTPQLFGPHATAEEVKAHFGEKIWNEYFTFAFERHPFDRVISFYYWHFRKTPSPPSLNAFIMSDPDGSFMKWVEQTKRSYCSKDEVLVDKLFQYESLNQCVAEIEEALGLETPLQLPRTKHRFRKNRQDPKLLLTTDSAEMIRHLFKGQAAKAGYNL